MKHTLTVLGICLAALAISLPAYADEGAVVAPDLTPAAELPAIPADVIDAALIEAPEPVILAWLVDRVPPPANADSDVLRLLLAHEPLASNRE